MIKSYHFPLIINLYYNKKIVSHNRIDYMDDLSLFRFIRYKSDMWVVIWYSRVSILISQYSFLF